MYFLNLTAYDVVNKVAKGPIYVNADLVVGYQDSFLNPGSGVVYTSDGHSWQVVQTAEQLGQLLNLVSQLKVKSAGVPEMRVVKLGV